MSRRSDEFDDVTDMQIGGPTPLGRGGSGESEVAQFLIELRNLGKSPAPVPSPEVAALLGGAPLVWRRRLRLATRTAMTAAAAVAVLVFAAARHSLPASAQRVVSNVINVVTPFHISPDPVDAAPLPAPGPAKRHEVVAPPSSSTSPTESDDGSPNHAGPSPTESSDGPTNSAGTDGGTDNGSAGASTSGDAGRTDEGSAAGGSGTDDGGTAASTSAHHAGAGEGTGTGAHHGEADDGGSRTSRPSGGSRSASSAAHHHHHGGDD